MHTHPPPPNPRRPGRRRQHHRRHRQGLCHRLRRARVAGAVWRLRHPRQDRPHQLVHPGPQGASPGDAALVTPRCSAGPRSGPACRQQARLWGQDRRPAAHAVLECCVVGCVIALDEGPSPTCRLLHAAPPPGVCRPAGGRHASVLVQRHDHEVGRQGRARDGAGGERAWPMVRCDGVGPLVAARERRAAQLGTLRRGALSRALYV